MKLFNMHVCRIRLIHCKTCWMFTLSFRISRITWGRLVRSPTQMPTSNIAMKGIFRQKLSTRWTNIYLYIFLILYSVVEFASYSDLKTAIEKLDGTDLNGRRIKLVEDKDSGRRGSRRRSRSRSSSRSRSRSRSRRRSRSRSRYKK
jgi:hypothetical protein